METRERGISNQMSDSSKMCTSGSKISPCMRRFGAIGALTVAMSLLLAAPAFSAQQFGAFDGVVLKADNSAATEAGSHPDETTVEVEAATTGGDKTNRRAIESPNDLSVDLPPGFIGNPQAVAQCTSAQFDPIGGSGCPAASEVGTACVAATYWAEVCGNPVYNMTPGAGEPARFAFLALGQTTVFIRARVRTEGDYGLTTSVNNISEAIPLYASKLTFFGAPGGNAFLTIPTTCQGPLTTTGHLNSYETPDIFATASFLSHDLADNVVEPTDCDVVPFTPTATVNPTQTAADSPTGLDVEISVPQEDLDDPNQLAQSHLKDTVVTLPEGIAVSPSAADGLGACSPAQFDAETATSDPGAGCPNASKIGTVEIGTPLLADPLDGSVFLAEPNNNPFGSLIALYIVAKSAERGVIIKLAGKVDLDPQSGQLTATFNENPQLPFSTFEFNFPPGPRASLITPQVCGDYEATTDLSPWSGGATVSEPSAFTIAQGAGGAPCPTSEAQQPLAPAFDAGSASPIAGANSPFVLHLRREDGSQRFSAVRVSPPRGLVARLAGTPVCSDAALAAAAGKSGSTESTSPSCPAVSQIGQVVAGVGPGPAPYHARGKVYLAGPYNGAPVSVATVIPATAGPFDLGTIVTRIAAHINPVTTQITAQSDPLPSILKGIPLDVKTIDIALDKPDFTVSPTSCDPTAVDGLLTSTLGQFVGLSARYQLGECTSLGFKPRMALRLKGGTRRGAHPALTATLEPRAGQANIASLSVALPRSEFLDQTNIGTVCTRVQFASSTCPEASVYGSATVHTPLLDYPLKGKVYLRSSDNRLPDLVPDLRGPAEQPIKLESAGRIDTARGGLRNTFDFVPDAPFSKLVLKVRGGSKGLLINSRDICDSRNRATVKFTAHNGDSFSSKPELKAQCKNKGGKKRKGKRRR
jgi:hypothetical protein